MKTKLLMVALTVLLLAAAPAGALTRRHTAAGTALARSVLLRRSDLGRGWSVSAAPAKSVPAITCGRFHPPTPGVIESGAAASPTFGDGSSGPFVSQNAYAFVTSAQRAAFSSRVARPALIRCVEAALVHGSSGGVHFTVTHGGPLPLPGLGMSAHGYRVRGTANTTDQSVDVYVDLILLVRGRTVATLSLSSFEQPVARKLELRLGRIAESRLSAR